MIKKIFFVLFVLFLTLCIWLYAWTQKNILEFDEDLKSISKVVQKPIYLDRYSKRLNMTYQNRWNLYDQVRLHELEKFLQLAFIFSEDKRFFSHNGVDYLARCNALWQNISSFGVIRGASTITEQVVRLLHPRPRYLSSRWLEGFEAKILEEKFSKLDILEFYLNQVPYKAKRKGIVQASRYYFDRDISTLNKKEMLSLVVLVRSPKHYDPIKKAKNLDKAILNLASRMYKQDLISKDDFEDIKNDKLDIQEAKSDFNAQHFLEFVSKNSISQTTSKIQTTLDASLQNKLQNILDANLAELEEKNVHNGAILVVDNEQNEILAWVVANAKDKTKAYSQINSVLVKRQVGSTFKPFLYAKAIEMGWSGATLIDDSPFEESVGLGMHTYHNYSRTHYGLISLREALGNSLNIPAVKTIEFVGVNNFLEHLKSFGISSLDEHPDIYGNGLALGNAEISLYEMTQAYATLANMGEFKSLSYLKSSQNLSKRVFSEDISSLIADILSDATARQKEFGINSILNFTHQTGVKTGTSSDYRDAWSIGYNNRYTVGIWFGNLDYKPMREVTGGSGPAYILRSVFNELNSKQDAQKLYLSPKLKKKRICIKTSKIADAKCEARDEFFLKDDYVRFAKKQKEDIRLLKPTNNLLIAMDPRIDDDMEYFNFQVTKHKDIKKVIWFLNDKEISQTKESSYLWRVKKGKFRARAKIIMKEKTINTKEINFSVL
nr:transglycosylase domain-containing protein [uncultured Sulfurimonas sp.]